MFLSTLVNIFSTLININGIIAFTRTPLFFLQMLRSATYMSSYSYVVIILYQNKSSWQRILKTNVIVEI